MEDGDDDLKKRLNINKFGRFNHNECKSNDLMQVSENEFIRDSEKVVMKHKKHRNDFLKEYQSESDNFEQ